MIRQVHGLGVEEDLSKEGKEVAHDNCLRHPAKSLNKDLVELSYRLAQLEAIVLGLRHGLPQEDVHLLEVVNTISSKTPSEL